MTLLNREELLAVKDRGKSILGANWVGSVIVKARGGEVVEVVWGAKNVELVIIFLLMVPSGFDTKHKIELGARNFWVFEYNSTLRWQVPVPSIYMKKKIH